MKATIEALKDLMAAYPHFKPPDPERTLRVYAKALRGLTPEALEYATDRILSRGGKFFPTIPEIVDAASRYQPESPNDPAGRFWYQMEELARMLRGGKRVPLELPEGVKTEWDELDPEELERLADEKAGYLVPEPF